MSQPSWIGYELNGRYKIDELLGSGGMSAVYRANDPNLRRVVAVKLIHTHLSKDPEFVRRFEAEAASVAQLRHPNIIQVFDFDNDGETYYMVMEFVPGETLQQRLKRLNEVERKLSVEEIVNFATGVADAADYAHKRGLIHRDIKPANVMLNLQGEAILMDFGIVKIVGGTQHTATGAVVGTALYMSPEQIRGERPDHRADIYSLGVMLFEMAGGRPPYSADSAMTVMMMHINDPIPDVGALNPAVPAGLRSVIQKSLAKDPADRYQSAGEMAAGLRQVLSEGPAMVSDGTIVEEPAAPAGATVVEQPVEGTVVDTAEAAPEVEKPVVDRTPPPVRQQPPPPKTKSRLSPALIGGGIIVVLVGLACLIGGGYLISRALGGGAGATGGEMTPTNTTAAILAATDTPETAPPSPTATATQVPATATTQPTRTNTPTITATATPDTTYVVIDSIGLDGSTYVVNYSVYNDPGEVPGLHVHLFFDTVPVEQAGVPGSGPWKLTYRNYGPSPYTGLGTANRGNATQLCALIANPNHTVIQGTGNCVDLPEG